MKKFIIAIIAIFTMFIVIDIRVKAESYNSYYYFTYIEENTKYDLRVVSNYGKAVCIYNCSSSAILPPHLYDIANSPSFEFYTYNNDKTYVELAKIEIVKEYSIVENEWVVINDYSQSNNKPLKNNNYYQNNTYGGTKRIEFISDIDILKINLNHTYLIEENGLNHIRSLSSNSTHLQDNVFNYLNTGKFAKMNKTFLFKKCDINSVFVPITTYFNYGYNIVRNDTTTFNNIYFNDKGILNWDGFITPDEYLERGVKAFIVCEDYYFRAYEVINVLPFAGSAKINLGKFGYYYNGVESMPNLYLQPYYVDRLGKYHVGLSINIKSIEGYSDIVYENINTAMIQFIGAGNYEGLGIEPELDDYGNVIGIDNASRTPIADFYLTDVNLKKPPVLNIGKPYYTITWTGINRTLPDIDEKHKGVNIYFNMHDKYDESNIKRVHVDHAYIYGKKYILKTEKIEEIEELYDMSFEGEIILIPYYAENQREYYGYEERINVYSGAIVSSGLNIDEEENEYIEEIERQKDYVNNSNIVNSENIGDYVGYAFTYVKDISKSIGQLPDLISKVFGFMPDIYFNVLAIALIIAVVLRILGR